MGSLKNNLGLLHRQPKFKVSKEDYISAKKQAGLEFSTKWTDKERNEVRKILQQRQIQRKIRGYWMAAIVSAGAIVIALLVSGTLQNVGN